MKATTEVKIRISGGEIIDAKVTKLPNGVCLLTVEVETQNTQNVIPSIVSATTYKPETTYVRSENIQDFWDFDYDGGPDYD